MSLVEQKVLKSTERNSDKCSHLLNYRDPTMTFL